MTGNARSGPQEAERGRHRPRGPETAPGPPQPRVRLFSAAPGVTTTTPDTRCTDCRRRLRHPSPDGLGPKCRARHHPTPVPRTTLPTIRTRAEPTHGQEPLFHTDNPDIR